MPFQTHSHAFQKIKKGKKTKQNKTQTKTLYYLNGKAQISNLFGSGMSADGKLSVAASRNENVGLSRLWIIFSTLFYTHKCSVERKCRILGALQWTEIGLIMAIKHTSASIR